MAQHCVRSKPRKRPVATHVKGFNPRVSFHWDMGFVVGKYVAWLSISFFQRMALMFP